MMQTVLMYEKSCLYTFHDEMTERTLKSVALVCACLSPFSPRLHEAEINTCNV